MFVIYTPRCVLILTHLHSITVHSSVYCTDYKKTDNELLWHAPISLYIFFFVLSCFLLRCPQLNQIQIPSKIYAKTCSDNTVKCHSINIAQPMFDVHKNAHKTFSKHDENVQTKVRDNKLRQTWTWAKLRTNAFYSQLYYFNLKLIYIFLSYCFVYIRRNFIIWKSTHVWFVWNRMLF